jgi:hypothetical protein
MASTEVKVSSDSIGGPPFSGQHRGRVALTPSGLYPISSRRELTTPPIEDVVAVPEGAPAAG